MIQELPILEVLSELKACMRSNITAILQAPPGAGKTTVVPLELLDEPFLEGKSILILEPRRIAAKNAACRMAQQLGETVGETVGYRVRMENRVSARTRVEVVTEGILTRRIQSDPELESVGCIIFDEFHERSLHADLGLALSLDIQGALRDDLRILLMSATLNGEQLAGKLNNCQIVRSEGRCYPVETHYLPRSIQKTLTDDVCSAVMRAHRENIGSILVFLPGVSEIKKVVNQLRAAHLSDDTDIFSLYGNLSFADQEKAITPSSTGRRKVVLATTIAETSITIEGVSIVIDSGLRRTPVYDINSGMTSLATVKVPLSSAEQRRGRAGRTAPGTCYRLWSESVHRSLPEHSSPEIEAAELSQFVLELAHWGVCTANGLAWIDSPPEKAFNEAQRLLQSLGALSADSRITEHGKAMIGLGLHPRLAHMIIKGAELGHGRLACELAALVSEKDILYSKQGYEDYDILTRIDLLRNPQDKKMHDSRVDRYAAKRIIELARVWGRKVAHYSKKQYNPDMAGVLLAFAYTDRIGRRRTGKTNRYQLSNGRGAHFASSGSLSREEFIVAANIAGRDKDAKVFLAAAISREAIVTHFKELCATESCVSWNNQSNSVQARELLKLGELVIDDKPGQNLEDDQTIPVLLEYIKSEDLECLSWTRDSKELISRINFLHRNMGSEWPDYSKESLAETVESWLTPYLSGLTRSVQLARIDLKAALLSQFDWNKQQELDKLAPTHLKVPAGPRIRLDYHSGDIPILPVKLQMMFGATETPRIAGGKVPVLIHLLSPAQRPVQITQDLAGFWKSSYHLVKKDLKGRYPKHYWPDDPSIAEPTTRTRQK